MANLLIGYDSGSGTCKCPCILPDGSCTLTFTYDNVNSIQDDAFNIYLIKNDGTEVLAGNIDGVCNSYSNNPPDTCSCAEEDVKTFDFTIDDSFISACGGCSINFRTEMTGNNGCGTYATFNITGPYGTGFGGFMGDSGTIDISTCCFP